MIRCFTFRVTQILVYYSLWLYTVGTGGGVPRLYVVSSQKVTSQKSVSRTVVVKSVDIGRCQTNTSPPVPPLPIWYKPRGGEGGGLPLQKSGSPQKKVSVSDFVVLLVMCRCRMCSPVSVQVMVQSASVEPRLCLGRARGCAWGRA